jgi:hypothetical protein
MLSAISMLLIGIPLGRMLSINYRCAKIRPFSFPEALCGQFQ